MFFACDAIRMHWLHLFFLFFLHLFFVVSFSEVSDFIRTGSLLYTDVNINKCELRRLTASVSGESQHSLVFILKIAVKQHKIPFIWTRSLVLPCRPPVNSHLLFLPT